MQLAAEEEVAALQQRYLEAVYEEMRQVVPSPEAAGRDQVHSLLRYHLGWEEADGTPSTVATGKALRPVLCLMACEMTGGEWKAALPAATAVELIHKFSLIHDDIQDRDPTRWGRATAWSVWGVPKAVIAGNAMRVLADQSLLNLAGLGLPAEHALAASSMLTSNYMEMIEGQSLDMCFEQSEAVTTEDYLDMIGRKTGALIRSAMYLGALVGSRDREVAQAFGRCGHLLGLAFQAQDDYLGTWGDPAKVGKPVGSDIRRKKKSLPVVHAFQEATGRDRERLREVYAEAQIEGPGVTAVMEVMDAVGSAAFVQQTAREYAGEAAEPLEHLELPPGVRRQIEAIAEFFVARDR